MLNTELDYYVLLNKAKKRETSILRILFDDYVYKHVNKTIFENSSKNYNRSTIQVVDHGKSFIRVKVKARGAYIGID